MTYVNMVLNHPWFNLFVLWSLLGLGVGVVAKIIIPGSENMGWIRTILLGLAGSFLGNFLTPRVFHWPKYNAFSWEGIAIGIGGAVILVLVNRVVTRS
ncbi:GlsB/YeaQ/YmgE family stress response membrane protein [Bdellovibrio bacteriovorus]|uniref:Transglycosylase associated protein n=1 Tax=Bdellovibrio bacteriovorus (strain ATCC 15356 / DSM 50701 / NCIMB 9529 / HD100) TaxID=264462 RepID=Q6MNH8_BDEBA|nr:GlsB/YeaQ/YmgE family stress response membrane protein [Bdellovibrio bacteriovorus]CAE79173.1 Transglycosylase associated protein [Bdellovibrio bacteriovorus HD100]